MIVPRDRAAELLAVAVLTVAMTLVAAACGPNTRPASPSPSTSPSPSSAPGPSLTAVPGGPSNPVSGASIALPSTTETEFGRIWDALPPSFPVPPGSITTDPPGGPTSGSFAVGMAVDDAARTMAAALTSLGWTADVATPLEDGTVVLSAGGPREGCAAEVRFTPLSGTVSMSVLYGAECPFN